MAVPRLLLTLLQARAVCGGTPARSSVGMAMSPPPPATESMKPANRAASVQIRMVVAVITGAYHCLKMTQAARTIRPKPTM